MQRVALILASAVLGSALFAWPGAPEYRTRQRMRSVPDEDKQVREILAATNPERAAFGYRALFKAATSEDLRRLQLNPSDTIAIQSAWEEVELTVPERPERAVRPDRDKLSRFIGFLEG